MAAGWSAQETKMLVSIWGEADVQSQLDGVIRNCVSSTRAASFYDLLLVAALSLVCCAMT